MHFNNKLIIASDYGDMSKKAADILEKEIRNKPTSVIGLATGGTPEGLYSELIDRHKGLGLNFSQISAFNLDEYHPIGKDDPQSYYYFMNEKLFSHININPQNTYIPDGAAKNPEQECGEYDDKIMSAGGIDFQVLGIGANGHIGFNEPSESFSTLTSYIKLTKETINANARFFASPDMVPSHALTMGIRAIMMAKKIMLLASGASKASIMKDAFLGPVTPRVPASILQLHPNVIVVADKAAASHL